MKKEPVGGVLEKGTIFRSPEGILVELLEDVAMFYQKEPWSYKATGSGSENLSGVRTPKEGHLCFDVADLLGCHALSLFLDVPSTAYIQKNEGKKFHS